MGPEMAHHNLIKGQYNRRSTVNRSSSQVVTCPCDMIQLSIKFNFQLQNLIVLHVIEYYFQT